MIYDNRQHTRPKRVSVRKRLTDGAVALVGERISSGMSFDSSFTVSVSQMWLHANSVGIGALGVNRMAKRVAEQVS